MNKVNSVYLRNLPFGISDIELKNQILPVFSTVLHGCISDIKVTIFKPTHQEQTAVISGFDAYFENLLAAACEYQIGGRKIIMKIDRGDERDVYGNFVRKLAPQQRRKLEFLVGGSNRKVTFVFTREFWEKINPRVFDGRTLKNLYLNGCGIDDATLKIPGRLQFVNSIGHLKLTKLQYSSCLDSLQAIRYLNLNTILKLPAPHFIDYSGNEHCVCADLKGLGANGSIISIGDELTQNGGIVYFENMDKTILNRCVVDNSFESYCWRCETQFCVIGVDTNLTFLGGTCNCNYTSELEILDPTRAYFWPGERFTRLAAGQFGTLKLLIMHKPMKQTYDSPQDYQNTVLPILQEEWKYSSYQFKELNSCSGTLSEFDYIETLIAKSGSRKDYYAIRLIVPLTKFWTPENISAFGKTTLRMKVSREIKGSEQIFVTSVKGKIRGITNKKTQLTLFMQAILQPGEVPLKHGSVSVIPKPNKTEYSNTKQIIRKWSKGGVVEKNNMMKIIIQPANTENYEFSCEEFEARRKVFLNRGMSGYQLRRLHSKLNIEQEVALENAVKYPISFIQGPPGTGKTFISATIVVTLVAKEKGLILVCAPSNVAADRIADVIQTLGKALKTKVLRVFSKKRERQYTYQRGKDFGASYTILHEKVRKSAKWMQDQHLEAIAKKIYAGMEYKLMQKELETMNDHIQELELEIVQGFDVIVSTVGALSDKRIEKWVQTRPVRTVLLDEAGQLSHPSTLPLLTIMPSRIIIVGDQMQLKSTVLSYAAEMAGLDRSIMDWVVLVKSINLPWTLLLEQHRMSTTIRKLVSAVSYQGQLRDSPHISSRVCDVTDSVYEVIPEFKTSPVAVVDHQGQEEQVENSFVNRVEASSVLELVVKIVSSGVDASKITVLTFYEAQKQLIRSKIDAVPNAKNVAVMTVDSFQGQENSIIIISFVRGNVTGDIGFTKIANRLNVSISRAKYFMLLCCNFEMFRKNNTQAWKLFTSELVTDAVFIKC